nr:polysaccharide biosynthesis C-terminal domain-containing protein [Paeniclostridium sordellii]
MQVDWLIGIWGLTSGLVIVLGHYSSEVFRAKGKPKLSFIAQVLHLVVLIPTCIIASKYGFFTLATARAIIRLEAILVNLILIHFIIGISIKNVFKNIKIPLICSIIMGGVGWMICNIYNSLIWGLISIFICMCIYIILLLCISESRSDINMIFNMFKISDKIKRLKTKIRSKKYERKSINNRI